MKVHLDCIPCFLRQALEAARLATDDRKVQEEVMRTILAELAEFPLNKSSPPEIGWRAHSLVKEVTGNKDPYAPLKHSFNQQALAVYPKLEELIEFSDVPFETAVRLALAGNMIDFGAQVIKDINLEEEIEVAIKAYLDRGAVLKLKTATEQAKKILFLGDNAGEIVFDKPLIKQIGPEKITYAVKRKPIINDATLEDAQAVTLTDLVNVIDNGSEVPGTILSLCSQEFLRHYNNTDLIVAKGQGHYETLSDEKRPIAFLFKVKCSVIAKDIKHDLGGLVVHLQNVYNTYKS
ncbi:MAG: hypothetical protein AMJ45_01450 [Syntrophobacter sp. DG_60]|nr:MAG: hypothetical protein AMJ45_01450 [Syntrophobacter sp. DG_60]